MPPGLPAQPDPMLAVHVALSAAACQGALLIAAAGNASAGTAPGCSLA